MLLTNIYLYWKLESLGQSELASRLTLNCQNSYVEPHKIRDVPVTIMDVSLSQFNLFFITVSSSWKVGCGYCVRNLINIYLNYTYYTYLNKPRFRINCCDLFHRYLTRAHFRLKQKKKCISFILMPEELISKQEAISRISAGVLRSTYIFK